MNTVQYAVRCNWGVEASAVFLVYAAHTGEAYRFVRSQLPLDWEIISVKVHKS